MTVIDLPVSAADNCEMLLMPHQVDELKYLQSTPRAFLLSESGTGKTPSLLAYAQWVMDLEGGNTLWVTEAGLIDQLKWEANRWMSSTSLPPQQLGKGVLDARFMVASHQWLALNREWLLGRSFDLVVVDEAHAVGGGGLNVHASPYTAVREAVTRSYRSVMATGTPVTTDHGLDVFALLEAGQAAGLMPRAEFLPLVTWTDEDSTEETSQPCPTDLTQEGVRHLQKVLSWNAVATDIDHLHINIPAIDRTLALTPSTAPVDDQELADTALSQILRHLDEGDSHIVVYAETKGVFEVTRQTLHDARLPCWEITSDVDMRKRTTALDQHRRSPKGVLLGTRVIEAGLNLQHCSHLISIVTRWNEDRQRQREGRIRRVGSSHARIRHTFIAPNTPVAADKFTRAGWHHAMQSCLMSDVPDAGERDLERELFL